VVNLGVEHRGFSGRSRVVLDNRQQAIMSRKSFALFGQDRLRRRFGK